MKKIKYLFHKLLDFFYTSNINFDDQIIVFESDDWGMERVSSNAAFNVLLSQGYELDKCKFNSNDIIENNNDVEELSKVLLQNISQNGSKPIFTLNMVLSNPNYKKIKEYKFKKYFSYEINEVYSNNHNSLEVLSLLKQGYEDRVFHFEFHCKDHFRHRDWLIKLQNGDKSFVDAFNQKMTSVPVYSLKRSCENELLDAFSIRNKFDFEVMRNSIHEGVNIFKKNFGYLPNSFIAPCYYWSDAIEEIFYKLNINIVQGSKFQKVPNNSKKGYSFKRRINGSLNKNLQIHLVRNCFFEPTLNTEVDWITSVLNDIESAFNSKQPAIICTHRINYVSGLNVLQRDKNLRLLNKLLSILNEKFPKVKYMSTVDLANKINNIKK